MQSYVTLLLIYFGFSFVGFSQTDYSSYEPLPDASKYESSVIKKMESRYEKDISTIPKKNKKELLEAYKLRYENTVKKLQSGHFLFEDSLNQYFDEILEKVLKSNPQIKDQKDIRIFISRYDYPNASCIGEGTLVLNIGLIRRLENESQAAFILCHELAHYSLDHANNAIHYRIEQFYSEKTKKKLNKIKRDEYNKTSKATNYLKDIVFEERKHSRLHESAADSFAIQLLKNTNYDLSEGIRTLELLDSIDREKYTASLKIDERFDSPKYPFKSRWLLEESGLNMKKADDFSWDVDSLKTHPDCKKRIGLLKNIISSDYNSPNTNVQKNISFDEFVRISDFEMISSNYAFGNYGKCLYHCLKMLNEYPDNAYINAMIGICFYEIYVAQKEHNLGRHVSLPSQNYKESYREFLQFIHYLRLKDVANISYYFIKKNEEKYQSDEHYLYALLVTANLMDLKTEVKKYKKEYHSKYPKGRYRSNIKDINNQE